MSLLVRPAKRKLDEVEGQERRVAQRFDNHINHHHHHHHHNNNNNNNNNNYDRQGSRSHGLMRSPATTTGRSRSQTASVDTNEQNAFAEQPLADRDLTSNRASPIPFDSPLEAQRVFNQSASIVLIGIRGTGKSSLAVILAATFGRRLIDADQYFEQMTGRSRAAFKKEYSIIEYRQQEARVIDSMLADHRDGCVIACGPGSMERTGQRLLREYAKTHPVVHVVRDPESIQAYLQAWDTARVRRFLELSGPLYRACSNLEFFNLPETAGEDHSISSSNSNNSNNNHHHNNNSSSKECQSLDHRLQSSTPFLTLKRLQRDFLRFIAFATGNFSHLRKQQASFPLSLLPIESRTYTYAVSVPLSALLERELDIEDLESSSDAFELTIDMANPPSMQLGLDSAFADRISQTVSTIRRHIIVPLIYHVESEMPPRSPSPTSHGGCTPGHARRPEEAYMELIRHGLRLAPEFLTVDLSYSDSLLSQVIAIKGSTRIIGHYAGPPHGWDEAEHMQRYDRARRLGCDLVRLSQPATSIDDNFAVQRFRHRIDSLPGPHPPIIAYNTGLLGRLSGVYNPILTPVTHRSLAAGGGGGGGGSGGNNINGGGGTISSELSPCLDVQQAREALYASFTLDPMRFYVFGANTTYSLSPAMHNAAYKLSGLPHMYSIHQSPTLRGLHEIVENPYFGGSSVSLPYKTEVIPLLHSMSPHARAIGAVNTLIPIRHFDTPDLPPSSASSPSSPAPAWLALERSRAGPVKALHGDNTDWIGICNCIRRGLSPANAVRPATTGVVIGAGGMARAAVYSLIHLGVQNIFVHNRTVAKAEKLAAHYNRQQALYPPVPTTNKPTVHVLPSLQDPWPTGFKQPTIVVSCIVAHSIDGQPPPNFRMPLQWLESPTGGVVVDLAYKPLNTPLIMQMRALSHRGWSALDGLDVLPEQGFAQFELFTGRRAPRRLMRAVVLEEYRGEEGQYDPSAMRTRLQRLDGQPN
ncbi:hypothetical protein ASPZODRAFT_139144 [Penicilliopsis zonata CBS 506.65]|uniref:Uncharacterized protein n=1 Tax=Penicilliopsis zonata CBS 506.65 TaxID=1073090 RepID=A0A1L9SRD9_9EURO|nr:hypothetical protein ASPZODRAFT_139144 [Penicilliopsis zonata CBS 506.65]OJJ49780.1 hypothetical protein ASPZODRAFT_139144 [Penicilliopsis zonata CBS 506.65]